MYKEGRNMQEVIGKVKEVFITDDKLYIGFVVDVKYDILKFSILVDEMNCDIYKGDLVKVLVNKRNIVKKITSLGVNNE